MRVSGSNTAAKIALPVGLFGLAMNGDSSQATEVSIKDVLHGSCAVLYHTSWRPSRTPNCTLHKYYFVRSQHTTCIQGNHCVALYVCVKVWRVMVKSQVFDNWKHILQDPQ